MGASCAQAPIARRSRNKICEGTLVSNMEELLPIADLQERFDETLSVEVLGMSQLGEITRRKPGDIHAIALNVWNRIVQMRLRAVDSHAVAHAVNNQNPKLHSIIAEIIGEPVIQNIIYMQATLPFQEQRLEVAEFLAAEVFPNDLHLADMLFQDPRRPIPPNERRYRFQTHRGLGLLAAVVRKAETFARVRNKDFITLTAADRDLVPLFGSYGFTVEENPAAQFILNAVGQGIPMEKPANTVGQADA